MSISIANPMAVLLSVTLSHHGLKSQVGEDVLLAPRSKWKQKCVQFVL